MTVDPKDLHKTEPPVLSTSDRFRFDLVDLQKTGRDFLLDMLGALAALITLDQAKILDNPSHLQRSIAQAVLSAAVTAIWRFLRANGRQAPNGTNGKPNGDK